MSQLPSKSTTRVDRGSPGDPGHSDGSATVNGAARRSGPGPAGQSQNAGTGQQTGSPLERVLEMMLAEQCMLVGGVGGVAIIRTPEVLVQHLVPAGHGPAGPRPRLSDQNIATLRGLVPSSAEQSVQRVDLDQSGVYGSGATHHALVTPLGAGGSLHGASIVLLPIVEGERVDHGALLARLAPTVARYAAFLWEQAAMQEASDKTSLREALELLDAAQRGGDVGTMGSVFAHEITRRFGCTRASIGLLNRSGTRSKLLAVSTADDIDARGPAAESLELAMDECVDQETEILYPVPESMRGPEVRYVARAHESLSQKFGPSSILSIPLRIGAEEIRENAPDPGDVIGAMVLERPADDPFPLASVPVLRLVSEFIGPAVYTRRLADRGVLPVLRDRATDLAVATVGPRYTLTKTLALVVLAVFVLSVLPIFPARVTAEAETKPEVSRLIPAPFQGYLDEVFVKPGEMVEQGQVLATLDTRELRLQHAQDTSVRDRLRTQLEDALTKRLLDEAAVIRASIREYDARIGLLEARLEQAMIRAPFDGQIARGELETLAGAQVDTTTPLFELIDPTRHVVEVRIHERDATMVHDNATGRLALSSDPGIKLPIELTRVNPSSEPTEGGNVYLAEARILDTRGVRVEPGMTGSVRLDLGEPGVGESTSLLAIVTRPLMDRVRLRMWW